MNRLPDPQSLTVFMRLIEDTDGPVLVHCRGGVHRAGLASAVCAPMRGGAPDEAREQLARRFNNAPIGRLRDLYEASSEPFIEWTGQTYPMLHPAEVASNR